MSQNHYDWIGRQLNRFYVYLVDALKTLGYTGECKTENYSLICKPCPLHYQNEDEMIIGLTGDPKKYFHCKYGAYDFTTVAITLRMKVNPQKELK